MTTKYKFDSQTQTKLDAISPNASIIFARQLESVDDRIFEFKKKELKHRSLIPVNNNVNPGADSYTYRIFDKLGFFKAISDFAGDLPVCDAVGEEVTSKLKVFGSSIVWSTEDIRRATFAGVPLERSKGDALRRAYSETESSIAWKGNKNLGIQGFIDNPNIPTIAAPLNAAATSTKWADKTPDEIIADITAKVSKIRVQSKGTFEGDTLVLPQDQFNIVSTTRLGTGLDSGERTIMDFILQGAFGINRIEWLADELKNAFTNGTEDGALLYEMSNDVLEQIIALFLLVHPPQEKNLSFTQPAEAKIGGVVIRFPIATVIMTGI
jgi:hypothetical protein